MLCNRTSIVKPFLYCIVFVFFSTAQAQKVCTDTTLTQILLPGEDSSIVLSKNCQQGSGNSYLLMRTWKNATTLFHSIVTKKDKGDNIQWSTLVSTQDADSSIILLQALELSDETSFVLGTIQSTQPPFHISSSPLLLHLDVNGNLIDSWRLDLKDPGKINGFFQCFLSELDADNLAILISYTSEDLTSAFVVMKVSVLGNCVWSDRFYKNNFFYADGMEAQTGNLIVTSSFTKTFFPGEKQGIHLLKINSADGSVLTSKSYENSFINMQPIGATNYSCLKTIRNGNYRFVYGTSKDNEANKIIAFDFDNSLNEISAKAISNINDIYLVRSFSITDDGAFTFGFFSATDANDQGYIVADSNFAIQQQRKLKTAVGYNFSSVLSNTEISLNDKNQVCIYSAVSNKGSFQLQSIKTNIYNRDTACVGSNFNEAIEEGFVLQPSDWMLDQQSMPLPNLSPYQVRIKETSVQKNETCSDIKEYKASLPNRLTECNADSVVLKANPGFVSYAWSPNDYSLQKNDSTLIVFPASDQKYFLQAKTYWGCNIYDTTEVIVYQSPKLQLPGDTSLCLGNNLTVDAGDGFVNYQWNDGTEGRFKTITDGGRYVVQALDSNGCRIKDSFKIDVFQLPTPFLTKNPVLCKFESDILSPGNFSAYLWQDGSTAQSYKVQDTGMYWVQVKDQNGCENSDTTWIHSIVDAPSKFIYADTSICAYETLLLKPFTSYSSYLWSDGSTASFLEIHYPGTYSLKVEDANGCSGEQSITVISKSCTNSLQFPSAFTPNYDGLNDQFKPLVQGPLKSYLLRVFNRWGELVFETINPLIGWTGVFKGKEQSGTFVWICQYQFLSTPPATKKGTVALIR